MITFATKIGRGHVLLTRGFTNFPLLCLQSWVIKKFGIMGKPLTTESFIKRCREKYGDNYDWSFVDYKGNRTKVKIVCNRCGTVLYKSPNAILSGVGLCKFCDGSGQVRNTKQFILAARMIHGDEYTYDKVEYTNSHNKVVITCKKHGDFEQTANAHLNGQGCPVCGEIKKALPKLDYNDVVDRCKELYGDLYSYDKVPLKYKDTFSLVTVTCKKHGDFQTKMTYLLRDHLCCPSCNAENMANINALTKEEFVNRALLVHGNNYDYSKVDYVNNSTKVCIICKKCGKEFWQKPSSHLYGSCCNFCNASKGEYKISSFLDDENINYIPQFRICNETLFCNNNKIICDFFLEDFNTIIEYNGEQHYRKESLFFKDKSHRGRTFEQQQERDMALRQYCKEHKIRLIEIPYTEYDNIETILKKELKLK